MTKETQTGALYQSRGVGCGGIWREVQKRGHIRLIHVEVR